MAINHKIKKIIFFAFGLVFGMIVMYFIVNQFLNNEDSVVVKKHVELSGFILGEKYFGKGNSIPSNVLGYSSITDLARLDDNRIYMIKIQLANEPSSIKGFSRESTITKEQLKGFWEYFENKYNITLKKDGIANYGDEVDGVIYNLYYLNGLFRFSIIDNDLRKIYAAENEEGIKVDKKKWKLKKEIRELAWESLSNYIDKFNSQQNNKENNYRLALSGSTLGLYIPLIAYSNYIGEKPNKAADLLIESCYHISHNNRSKESSGTLLINARPSIADNADILDELVKKTFYQMNFQKSIIEDMNECGILYFQIGIEHTNGPNKFHERSYSNELKFDGTWK